MPQTLTLTITDDEIAALDRATWHAQTGAPVGRSAPGLVSLLRKVAPHSPTLAELARIARTAAVKTTNELLAEHGADLDAEIARRRSAPEIVAGGSP
ncbi:MAG: hypothetical protein E6J90_11350 [Deltaproteobacteria bacterium]|nr:MAG: hypothetical protein E6J91_19735 [Deltaproteobacteria bacterium]TMQ23090.1 MAG: hypothetical protein E6J90_11350 [Deltaproteobacteria bacterium]